MSLKLFLDALKNDVVYVNTNKNIKQSYNFKISWIRVFKFIYTYLLIYIAYADEV